MSCQTISKHLCQNILLSTFSYDACFQNILKVVGRFGDTFKQRIIINSSFLIPTSVFFPLHPEMCEWKLVG